VRIPPTEVRASLIAVQVGIKHCNMNQLSQQTFYCHSKNLNSYDGYQLDSKMLLNLIHDLPTSTTIISNSSHPPFLSAPSTPFLPEPARQPLTRLYFESLPIIHDTFLLISPTHASNYIRYLKYTQHHNSTHPIQKSKVLLKIRIHSSLYLHIHLSVRHKLPTPSALVTSGAQTARVYALCRSVAMN
jgi:hypothetical protein